jgi:hypothetical protein
MAIAIDASSPIRFTGTPANNVDITSASFTAPANSLLVVHVSADTNGSSADITISVSDSGGLTWTNRVERDPGDAGAEAGHASIWTAEQPTSASRTVSVRRTAGNGSTNRISVKVEVVTGADIGGDPIGNVGEGSSTTNNITPNAYTSSADNSRGFGCATCWNQLGTPTSTDTEDGADYSGAISVISLYKAANTPTSGSTVTMNFDAGGTGAAAWNWVALEVLPAAAGTQTITATGIASAEAFGTSSLQLNIDTTGIASAEAFGTPSVQLNIDTTGIASGEAFGTPALELNISATGIPSAEAFGTPVISVAGGDQTITATGIPSAEAFGIPTLTGGAVTEIAFNTLMTATVTLATVGKPVYVLMEETLGTFPRTFQGRVADLSIQHQSGTFHLVYKEGTVNLTTDSGFEFADVNGKKHWQYEARDNNQLSLGEVYLAGSVGGETAKITVHII